MEILEFDIHESADGDVLVLHDEKVDRTTDGQGEVIKLSTSELRGLSAGAWFGPRFASERIPFLDEVLDLCASSRTLPLIEIKAKHKKTPGLGEKVVASLERHGLRGKAVIVCREAKRVEDLHTRAPETPIGALAFTKWQCLASAKAPDLGGADCYWRSLSLKLVEDMHRAGAFLIPWTVNRRRDMERLLLIGVETIVTDCPVELRDTIEAFEFMRVEEALERFRANEKDIDLEEGATGADSPAEVSKRLTSSSEAHLRPQLPEELDDW